MKVLKIIHTRGHGGAENVFRWLAWELQREGVDVIAMIPEKDPSVKEYWIGPALEEVGVPYRTFNNQGTRLNIFMTLRRMIKDVRPDIVHSHLLDSNFYSALACWGLSIPHLSTEHGDIALKTDFSSNVKFFLLPFLSDSIVCVSNAVKEQTVRLPFQQKFSMIYNGIIFDHLEESTFRKELGLSYHNILIGNVGNLYPVKGQRYLIEAFSRFLPSFPDAYLILVGRGRERENLESQVKELEIPKGRVIFTGFRNDVENIISSLDIYVQPSLSEGLPVALLEAMSHQVPAIASSVGGIPEVFGKNEHGLLVAPGSSNELYEAMRNVTDNLGTFKSRAKVSRDHIKENFSLNLMAKKYLQLYKKALDA